VDPRFGRCAYFVIVETEDMGFEALANESGALGHGAGIQAARLMAEQQVKAVLTGRCGPNAHETLRAADIEVMIGCSGTVADAVEAFKTGRLSAATKPNAARHAGMGGRRQ
jgi:predicted Fe-Mo cluster-binding NifX family protein